ncbi:Kelch protein 2 [Fasciola gigantica]|uniref:Kelch protein 2 n=1 Tax=Fasciola gigantica TaxID=46835 RepID=A0A504Y7W5_FASGI|nr:Kelch protein 2 [Fasciola gigantica]
MPQARARHAAVAVGGSSIYVFGGLSVSHQSDDNSELTPMEQEQQGTQRTSSTLWHTPGTDAHHTDEEVPRLTVVNTIIRYDVRLDVWSTVGRTNEPRLESRVVIVDDHPSPSMEGNCLCENEMDDCPTLRDLSDDTSVACGSCSFTPLNKSSGSNRVSNGNGNSNGVNSNANTNPRRRRQTSAPNCPDRTLVELGGVTPSQPHGTDHVLFYCLRDDLTVLPTEAYIKLPRQMRYLNCAVHSASNNIYLFWEQTSELSVLDLVRRTLRPLATLVNTTSPTTATSANTNRTRIHSGLTWVGNRLYVVGGFSEFVGDDRRPTMPRDDVHCYDPESNSWSVDFRHP